MSAWELQCISSGLPRQLQAHRCCLYLTFTIQWILIAMHVESKYNPVIKRTQSYRLIFQVIQVVVVRQFLKFSLNTGIPYNIKYFIKIIRSIYALVKFNYCTCFANVWQRPLRVWRSVYICVNATPLFSFHFLLQV